MATPGIESRVSATNILDAGDVEALYTALIQQIGGTRYGGGTPSGPFTGVLDWRNFSNDAGIPATLRAEKYSLTCLNVGDSQCYQPIAAASTLGKWLSTPGTYVTDMPIPAYYSWGATASMPPVIVGASLVISAHGFTSYNAAGTNTVDIKIIRNSTPVTVTTHNIAAYNPSTSNPLNVTGLNIPIYAGDRIQTTVTLTNALVGATTPTMRSAANLVWIKIPHVR